jgi:hypothetical protein
VRVVVDLPQGKGAGPVTLLSPDTGESSELTATFEQGRVRFAVPHLDTYTVAILHLV